MQTQYLASSDVTNVEVNLASHPTIYPDLPDVPVCESRSMREETKNKASLNPNMHHPHPDHHQGEQLH